MNLLSHKQNINPKWDYLISPLIHINISITCLLSNTKDQALHEEKLFIIVVWVVKIMNLGIYKIRMKNKSKGKLPALNFVNNLNLAPWSIVKWMLKD